MCDGPLNRARDGLHVAIRLSPRGKADRLLAIAATAEGRRMIKASVTAPPENGRANEALLQLLARAWHVPRRDLAIVAGFASRNKIIRISGDAQRLIAKIAPQIAALHG